MNQFRTSFLFPVILLLAFGAGTILLPSNDGKQAAPSIDIDLWGASVSPDPKDPCPNALPPDTLFSATDTGGGLNGKPEASCPLVTFSMPPLVPEVICPPPGPGEESPGSSTGSPGVAGIPDPFPALPFEGGGGVPDAMTPGGQAPLDSLFVNAANGELTQARIDLQLPGAPFQFTLARVYHSTNAGYNGVMGDGWELNALQRVRVTQSDPMSVPPGKPTLFWIQQGDGRDSSEFAEMASATNWYSASGRSDQLEYLPAAGNDPPRLIRYMLDGSRITYTQLEANDYHYHMTRSEDIWGNGITMEYVDNAPNASTSWTLDKVIDDLGREFRFTYDSYHGRLIEVAAFDGTTQIAAANYTYEEKNDGTVVLVKAETGYSATNDGSGGVQIERVQEEYEYALIDSQLNPYTKWRLSAVINGESETVTSWEYEALGDDNAIVKQTDRPGSTIRAEGVHTYEYDILNNKTMYTSPDGHRRDFIKDSSGRIWKRVEYPNPQNLAETLVVIFDYDPSCNSCSKISQITFPDGSYRVLQYADADSQLTALWQYPVPSSGLPPRVERWSHSLFDPSAGFMRKRVLEHELQRDANPIEDPTHPCNHPSCDDLQGLDGHIVRTYTWSADEKSLLSIDFGSIQVEAGTSPAMISRTATYKYFTDGRLENYREFEDGTEVSKTEFVLDPSKIYVASSTIHDSILNESWTTTYTRTPSTFFLDSVTDVQGTTTKMTMTSSGQVYLVEEDWSSGGSQRATSLWYDKGGRLVESETSSGSETKHAELKLDESGSPYEIETKQGTFPARLTKIDLSAGGLLLSTEDWRGWKSETEFGVGSLTLPIKVTEKYMGQTRDIWKAGDGLQDSGYDDMGRLTSYRNVDDWISYQLFDPRGRLASVHHQADATHYASRAFFYDARGHLREREVGSIDGDPLTATPAQFTWLQHIVYVHNLAGHLLSEAVYESGPQGANSRLTRYQTDGRGRPILTTRYQGDKSQAPVAVAEEVTYDALNRLYQLRQLEAPGSANAVRILDAWYMDSTGIHTYQETLESGAKRKIDLVHDSLGRMTTRTETPWVNGAWGTGRSWLYTYDGFDNTKSEEDPYGVKKEWDGTDLGQLEEERVIRKDGLETQTTTYTYNTTNGSLSSVLDAEGKTTLYQTNPANWLRPQKVTYADGRIFEFLTYDNLGRRLTTRDDRGVIHTYSYDYGYLESDVVTKPQGQNIPGPDALTWVYDRDKGTLLKSRVWENQVATWQTTYTHNDLGELLTETQGAGGDAMTWAWEYGYSGELLEVSYPTGLGIDKGYLGYDTAGRVNALIYEKGATQLSNETLSYDGFRLDSRSDSISGIDVDFRFDEFGRMDKLFWSKQISGSTVFLDGQERAFDIGNHVIARQRILDSSGDVFVHDGYGRMEGWYEGVSQAVSSPANTVPASYTDAEHYTLNKVFARTSVVKELNGVSQPPISYTTNDAHFYTYIGGSQRTVVDGRLNSDANYYYDWDAWGKLHTVTEISSGTAIRKHHYDAEGRRVRTEISDGTNTSVSRLGYWGNRLAASYTEGIAISNVRTYGYTGGADGESFVEVSASGAANGSYAIAKDFQGTVLALINRSTNSVVERYRYDIFGAVSIEDGLGQGLSSSAYGNIRFFLGRPFDSEVGIYDLRARWYQPNSGSFLSPDPLGAFDSFNLFQYGFGSPGTWMDPFGLQGGEDGGWAPPPSSEILDFLMNSTQAVADGFNDAAVDMVEGGIDGIKAGANGLQRTGEWGIEVIMADDPRARLNAHRSFWSDVQDAGSAMLGGLEAEAIESCEVFLNGDIRGISRVATHIAFGGLFTRLSKGLGVAGKAGSSARSGSLGPNYRPRHEALPTDRYVFHYTDAGGAEKINLSGELGREGRVLYLTNQGDLSPTAAAIELALDHGSKGHHTFRVPVSLLDRSLIQKNGRVQSLTDGPMGRAGGGHEILYNGVLPGPEQIR